MSPKLAKECDVRTPDRPAAGLRLQILRRQAGTQPAPKEGGTDLFDKAWGDKRRRKGCGRLNSVRANRVVSTPARGASNTISLFSPTRYEWYSGQRVTKTNRKQQSYNPKGRQQLHLLAPTQREKHEFILC